MSNIFVLLNTCQAVVKAFEELEWRGSSTMGSYCTLLYFTECPQVVGTKVKEIPVRLWGQRLIAQLYLTFSLYRAVRLLKTYSALLA